MILYNTIVGLAAGVGLLLVAHLLKRFVNSDPIHPEGFALAFGITGFIQTVLGLTISVMWPYTQVLHANLMMGEPALATSDAIIRPAAKTQTETGRETDLTYAEACADFSFP